MERILPLPLRKRVGVRGALGLECLLNTHLALKDLFRPRWASHFTHTIPGVHPSGSLREFKIAPGDLVFAHALINAAKKYNQRNTPRSRWPSASLAERALLQGRFDALLRCAFHASLEVQPTHPCVGVRSMLLTPAYQN